jgi:predicted transcriptional regulator
LDIIADILRVVGQSAKKTRIMFQANLSYKLLQKYLVDLSEASLIDFEPEKQCYVITAKGREFIDTYVKYNNTSKSLESPDKADQLSVLISSLVKNLEGKN